MSDIRPNDDSSPSEAGVFAKKPLEFMFTLTPGKEFAERFGAKRLPGQRELYNNMFDYCLRLCLKDNPNFTFDEILICWEMFPYWGSRDVFDKDTKQWTKVKVRNKLFGKLHGHGRIRFYGDVDMKGLVDLRDLLQQNIGKPDLQEIKDSEAYFAYMTKDLDSIGLEPYVLNDRQSKMYIESVRVPHKRAPATASFFKVTCEGVSSFHDPSIGLTQKPGKIVIDFNI